MASAKELLDSWRNGRVRLRPDDAIELGTAKPPSLADRCRRAYDWLSRTLIAPYHDLHFGSAAPLGPRENQLQLHEESYSSFLLLPLLSLMTSQRLLIVGGPGRGKTTMATLMGLLAGIPFDELRTAIQHGHPQLTSTDLLGSPLPSQLVRAESPNEIRVSWRRWLSLRVKIIDEYNRIPTKTQSALLSLMAEGYAELFEQTVRCGHSAWFLTANDDLGGGTFQVIEALKDRIDLVVRSPPFHGGHVDALAERVQGSRSPEQGVPSDIVFTPAELDRAEAEIRAVPIPSAVVGLLGFFADQLDFCRRASDQLESQSKEVLHLSGKRVAHVCTQDCPLDKQVNLCAQTENGVSARALQSILLTAKALAWFRGSEEVSVEELRAAVPWTLLEKLKPNAQSEFFLKEEHEPLLHDRAGWLERLFDSAVRQSAAHQRLREPLEALRQLQERELSSLTAPELRQRADEVRQKIDETLRRQELNGPVHADLVLLKDLHAKYRARLAALRRPSGGT